MCIIIDAKYKKANLNKAVTKQCQHLNAEEIKRLLILLRTFEDLFDVTLVTRNNTPVDLELKGDVKPVCSQPYPVTRVHKEIFRKEVKRLVSLGVLEEANNSKWGAPPFVQPKAKTNRI